MAQKSYQEVMQALRPNEEIKLPDEIPDELPQFREPPQPGSFRFQIPGNIDECWGDPLEVAVRDAEGNVIPDPTKKGQLDPKTGQPYILTKQRVQLIFDAEHSLTIVQSPRGEYDNEPFPYRINNVERNRSAGGGVKVPVSDMTYLLRALDPNGRPKTNPEFIQACVTVLPGKTFGADLEWSGFCNPAKEAYFAFEGENGATVYETAAPEGSTEPQHGCSSRIYMSKWPKDPKNPGRYAERATCPKCNASLRPFPSLVRFKA